MIEQEDIYPVIVGIRVTFEEDEDPESYAVVHNNANSLFYVVNDDTREKEERNRLLSYYFLAGGPSYKAAMEYAAKWVLMKGRLSSSAYIEVYHPGVEEYNGLI